MIETVTPILASRRHTKRPGESWGFSVCAAVLGSAHGRTHVRLYGLDFPKLLASHGFVAEEIPFSLEENERHRLAAEKVYVGRKPAAN